MLRDKTALLDNAASDELVDHAGQNPSAAEVSRNVDKATGVGTYICCNGIMNDQSKLLLDI